jgi:Ca2+-binding EF-hand superfamily protein
MRNLTGITTFAVVLGLGSAIALADSHEMGFSTLDADGDGQISKEEFVGHGEMAYDDAVTQSPDDKLFTRDYAEQRIHRDDEPVDTVNLDPNEDEYVDRDEAMADWDASFTSLDEDGNGMIDEDEWAATGK